MVREDGQCCKGEAAWVDGTGVAEKNTTPPRIAGAFPTADSCDYTANDGAGGCVHTPIASCCSMNAFCDDGNACNGVETCDFATGNCLPGTPVVCNDGDVCTTDTCDTTTGTCAFPHIAGCCDVDADCNDGDG